MRKTKKAQKEDGSGDAEDDGGVGVGVGGVTGRKGEE